MDQFSTNHTTFTKKETNNADDVTIVNLSPLPSISDDDEEVADITMNVLPWLLQIDDGSAIADSANTTTTAAAAAAETAISMTTAPNDVVPMHLPQPIWVQPQQLSVAFVPAQPPTSATTTTTTTTTTNGASTEETSAGQHSDRQQSGNRLANRFVPYVRRDSRLRSPPKNTNSVAATTPMTITTQHQSRPIISSLQDFDILQSISVLVDADETIRFVARIINLFADMIDSVNDRIFESLLGVYGMAINQIYARRNISLETVLRCPLEVPWHLISSAWSDFDIAVFCDMIRLHVTRWPNYSLYDNEMLRVFSRVVADNDDSGHTDLTAYWRDSIRQHHAIMLADLLYNRLYRELSRSSTSVEQSTEPFGALHRLFFDLVEQGLVFAAIPLSLIVSATELRDCDRRVRAFVLTSLSRYGGLLKHTKFAIDTALRFAWCIRGRDETCGGSTRLANSNNDDMRTSDIVLHRAKHLYKLFLNGDNMASVKHAEAMDDTTLGVGRRSGSDSGSGDHRNVFVPDTDDSDCNAEPSITTSNNGGDDDIIPATDECEHSDNDDNDRPLLASSSLRSRQRRQKRYGGVATRLLGFIDDDDSLIPFRNPITNRPEVYAFVQAAQRLYVTTVLAFAACKM